jgi:lipopolysaccharide/colanic/teichoic acid biosynthesis glycosyltransferase
MIRLDGQGPAIFRQIRIGAHGKEFVVYKFRTMIPSPAGEFSQATPNDPRVTQLGRLLRRTSLDEVLQLVNVIRGEMSLVGPRPHAPETHVEGIPFEHAVRYYRLRHRVKPGITGLAQIRGQRGETQHVGDLIQRIASDLEYIENWSIWLDLKIIAKTLPIVIRQTNAY